ncbi:hypothetical protein BGZ61DRAFT_497445 [Ilyonectria robusta]|uniref:uncharacterized protein n=1 Tax=Ilyonectria robusta TaxID=1079257 RepID=UPI001E8CCC32|nr:uncharacterized protein BGZ61DRAFT_497445 [Ilyonectria robusta]KAH8672246.1 hypothetical protein BGZ61DRAFT_497445 [Ilyonectria robusta]
MIRRRKGHRKSREGCLQCKERHAKCNEVHPQCLQCERADISCSFSSPALTMTPLNEDSLADLELLEHWHRHPITGDMTETTKNLQYDLVRLGFSHHYLLNSILGLTALQLYSEDQSQSKWYARAVAHQQAAITRARPHFESLDQTQRQALLGFSAFTSMYAVAEPVYRPPRVRSLAQFDPIEELLKALRFSRCTSVFVQQNFPPLVVSESWLLTKFDANYQYTRQDLEIRYPQLASLRACIEHRCVGEQKAACLHAVNTLFRRIATLSDNPEDPEPGKVIWGWGLEVYQIFLDLCSARHPVALVILAYFTVLMTFYKEHWCMGAWPGGLLGYIMGVLGDEWGDALKWPSGLVFESETSAPKGLPRLLAAA